MWHPEQPYNDLPLLPPEGEVESKTVLRLCIRARAAVAELKQSARLIPNQTVLINTLPLLEAQASSEIENIVTTADRLFQHLEAGERADPATKEALRYRRALMESFADRRRPIGTSVAETICSRIRNAEMQVRRVPGTKLINAATGEVTYTPPDGEERLRRLLSNWERFLNEPPEFDPLILMAIGHYQFEAIHPFTDGNGRTGRILNSLYLIQTGLLDLPILYLSRYIIRQRSRYNQLLIEVTRDHEWESWLLFMLAGVEETARWTTDRILAIDTLQQETRSYLKRLRPKIYSHELVETIFEQPYCRISDLVAAGIARRQTASAYLKELVEVGLLVERKVGREKLFINPRLMTLLTSDESPAAVDPST